MRAVICVGLGYGDEGKGQCVDHLTRELGACAVVRYCGGSQAAHNVIAPDGRHHTFAQFGAGTFAGAETFLDREMMVNPFDMFNELAHLDDFGVGDAWGKLAVHRECRITTPIHAAANIIREFLRGTGAHGSCHKGIGETVETSIALGDDALRVGDLGNKDKTRRKLGRLVSHYKPFWSMLGKEIKESDDEGVLLLRLLLEGNPQIMDAMVGDLHRWHSQAQIVGDEHLLGLLERGTVIFEGAQGLLLDEYHGFNPHTTWADVTPAIARRELAGAGLRTEEIHTVGVTRAYSTRHGAGPFPSGSPGYHWPEPHNPSDGEQGQFKVGPFDSVAFQYAVKCTNPDSIAVTHLDRFPTEWPIVRSYENGNGGDIITEIEVGQGEQMTSVLFGCKPLIDEIPAGGILAEIEQIAGLPVSIVGYGPSSYQTRTTS